ncbi:MAG: alpha/beta fold hydrolase [Thiobacillus sp.]
MKPQHLKIGNADCWVYNFKSDKPTLIMIHGLRGTHHGLDLAAKELDKFKVIVPDLPGFGKSKPLDNRHSVSNYVEWLKEFFDDLDLKEKPTLLGHSFGSIITSHFAKKYPDMISNLVLVNPIGAPALEGKGALSGITKLYYWLGRILPETLGRKLLSSKLIVMIMSVSMAKTKDKKTRKFIHKQHLTHFSSFQTKRVIDEAFLASINNDVREVASGIKVPTLIIAGDIDDVTPIHKQHELTNIFPNAKIKVITGVGHLTHYEKPDVIVEEINSFLT